MPCNSNPPTQYSPFRQEDLATSIPDFIERLVARFPHKTAIHTRTEQLTYSQLNARANRAARYYLSLRPDNDEPVAVMFGHGATAIVALLAALKCGKPYAVLDPSFPAERLSYTLERLGAGLLIHDQENVELAERLASLQQVTVGLLGAEEQRFSPDNLGLRFAPERISYVIFTSGSTGKPKGVMCNHQLRMAGQMEFINRLRASPEDRLTSLHSIAFSAAATEIYGAIMTGATVYPLDIRLEGFSGLRQWMLEHRITVFQWIPSASRRFFADLPPDFQFPDLRLMVLGSEPVSPRDIELCRRHVPDHCLIVNRYGATEVGNTSYYLVDRTVAIPGATVPVGYPVATKAVEVLDPAGQPLPPGSIGEIAVTSTYISPGYWRDPELTAAKFELVPGSSGRRYRTGDLGRLAPDGCLDHLGRMDAQVKVRGHRIELVEIEAALLSIKGIRDAASVALPDPSGQLALAAYVVMAPGCDFDTDAIRDRLRKQLPEYMLPASITYLEALPLTPTGKVQRTALPPPAWTEVSNQTPFAAAETDVQRKVLGVFVGVLEQDRIGIDDDFFLLGGDSLRAAQVVGRLQQQLGRRVPPTLVFDVRTVRGVVERLEGKQAGEAQPDFAAIPRLPDSTDAPLSFAQQRLWFLDRLEPTSTAYNEPLLLALEGVLDIPSLARALDEIVRRHEVLRSTFPLAERGPVQRVAEACPVPLPLIDISGQPPEDQESAFWTVIAETTSERFDLERGPLLRARLVRMSDTSHRLALVIHHIATDGISFDVLLGELETVYRGEKNLPLLRVQYRDFAAWQRSQEFAAEDLQFWIGRLRDVPPLELPTDFPRPLQARHDGHRRSVLLPRELSRAITRLASEANATPFMLLLSAFALLLGRWCRAEVLIIGAPIADRPHPDTEGLIGIFLNNLSLRVDLTGNPTFRELLARVRAASVDAYAHRQVPFEQVVDALRLERDTSRHPVFEVMCNHLSAGPLPQLPGLTVERMPPEEPAAKLPITLYSGMRDERLRLSLVYQSALFQPERMDALLEQLEWVLRQATKAPDQPILGFSLVTESARRVLPDPAVELGRPRVESVIETFLTRAALKPTESAIVQGDNHWSYERLADAMESVAAQLGVEREGSVVAVTGPRSPELIAAVLGVLRAGCTLLTLDPALPPTRRDLMLHESGCRLVLGSEDTVPSGIPGLMVRRIGDLVELGSTNPARHQKGDAGGLSTTCTGPAYVFFTSGSTGTPKAVLGTHEGLAHFIKWQRESFEIGRGDRCAQLTGLSFDVFLRDLFLPLTSGAALCLPEATDVESGEALFSWLRRAGVTAVHLVPSLTRYWLAGVVHDASLPCLRYAFFAGEPLTDGLVRDWRSSVSRSAEVVNLYGPTETTLAKLGYRVPADPTPGIQPVGEPLPETQALILNSSGQQCGLYEPGEIVIRTPFSTRGYLHPSVEDAKRFAPNPFREGTDNEDLLYRTGDLGYARHDGALSILGRLDQQLKILGVRIEPGEVEAALLRVPGVREAVVAGQESPAGVVRLVAYLVVTPGAELESPELRRFLAEVLPPALVPADYVMLDRIPLNASGKLDRSRLLKPAPHSLGGPRRVAPRDEVERRLLEIWTGVLSVPVTSIQDDFFALGGHSLLAVQLLARVEREFGRSLPLASIMHASTIAELADLLRVGQPVSPQGVLLPIQPLGSQPALFAVHGIGGGVLCYRELAAYLGNEQPFYGLQAPALAGEPHEHLSVEEMATRYAQAVREVQPRGPYRLLGLSFGGNIALEMAQQLTRDGEQVAFLGLLDSKGPGYPRFPGRVPRAKAHLGHFLNLPATDCGHYLRVRAAGLRDLTRRRILVRWYDRVHQPGETLPRVLEDIGISHLRAAREYRRQPYAGRITLFRTVHQPIGCIPEWDNGWTRVTSDVVVHPVPGEHASMVEEPHVPFLAIALAKALAATS